LQGFADAVNAAAYHAQGLRFCHTNVTVIRWLRGRVCQHPLHVGGTGLPGQAGGADVNGRRGEVHPAAHPVVQSSGSVTVPAPTVRPPSRIAKPMPPAIATGSPSSTVAATVSPGSAIPPPARSTSPTTSVVRR
jgi:hypothetical protein